MKTNHPIVDEISTMHFKGIVIDHRWLGHPWLCKVGKNGNRLFQRDAAYILAEICYFYSAKVERDPEGHVVRVSKRFDGETMYQDYETWAEKIGCTKGQLADNIAFLVKQGLIERWAEPVILRNGIKTNNMPHIRPVPQKIHEMTFGGGVPIFRDTPPGGKETPQSADFSGHPSTNSGGPAGQIPDTSNGNSGDINSMSGSNIPTGINTQLHGVDFSKPVAGVGSIAPIVSSEIEVPPTQRGAGPGTATYAAMGQETYERLIAIGFNPPAAAKRLLEEYGIEPVKEQLDALPYRKGVQSPPGFIRKALSTPIPVTEEIRAQQRADESERLRRERLQIQRDQAARKLEDERIVDETLRARAGLELKNMTDAEREAFFLEVQELRPITKGRSRQAIEVAAISVLIERYKKQPEITITVSPVESELQTRALPAPAVTDAALDAYIEELSDYDLTELGAAAMGRLEDDAFSMARYRTDDGGLNELMQDSIRGLLRQQLATGELHPDEVTAANPDAFGGAFGDNVAEPGDAATGTNEMR